MKKFLVFVLIAMLSMVAVFAEEDPTGTGSAANSGALKGNENATTELLLTLSESSLNGYNFGFCESQATSLGNAPLDIAAGIPTDIAKNVRLSYSSTTGKATGSVYYYYKIRTNNEPTLVVSAEALSDGTPDTIDFTIECDDFDQSVDTAKGQSGTLTPVLSNGFASKSGLLSITTVDITPDQASATDYTATVTLTVSVG